jgi:hypothetical protein
VEWITRFRKTEAKYFCEKGWTRHFGKRASDLPVGQITSPMDKGPSMSSGHDRRKLTSGRGQPELIDRSAEHRRNLGLQIRPGDVCKGRIHGKGAEPALGHPELGQHGALVGRHVVERPTCGVLRGPRRPPPSSAFGPDPIIQITTTFRARIEGLADPRDAPWSEPSSFVRMRPLSTSTRQM